MTKKMMALSLLVVCFLAFTAVNAEQTVGLFVHDSTAAWEGYTLFMPLSNTTSYLIDNNGREVHRWESTYFAQGVYLLENGHLLSSSKVPDPGNPVYGATGGATGMATEWDWDGTLLWEFTYSDSFKMAHHDIEALPNGNVLMIAWEYKSYDEAIAAGRDSSLLPQNAVWPDHVIEYDPDSLGGTIVWEWHVWDHLVQDYDPTKANYGVVADHPELVDLNFDPRPPLGRGKADWNHLNSVDYNAEFDQILLSSNVFSELWVIDHSTTTAEAAGHTGGNSGKGGDILYRWGNPQAYDRGTSTDQKFFKLHDPNWIKPGLPGEGNILIFNNGNRRSGNQSWSSIDEIVPPVDSVGNYYLEPDSSYGPDNPIWTYEDPSEFHSQNISGCQRLPNGNTLICEGAWGTLFEVTPDTDIVWLYINPVLASGPMVQGDIIPAGFVGTQNAVFKISRYAQGYPGFIGHTLTPGDPIEVYMVNDLVIEIDSTNTEVTLTWNATHIPFYPHNYHVYSSAEPDTNFTLVHTTTDTTWSSTVSVDDKYYWVTFELAP